MTYTFDPTYSAEDRARGFARAFSFPAPAGTTTYDIDVPAPALLKFRTYTLAAGSAVGYTLHAHATPRLGLSNAGSVENRRSYLYLPFGGQWRLALTALGPAAGSTANGDLYMGVSPEEYLAQVLGPPSELVVANLVAPGATTARLLGQLNLRYARLQSTAAVANMRLGSVATVQQTIPVTPAYVDLPSDFLSMQSVVVNTPGAATINIFAQLD